MAKTSEGLDQSWAMIRNALDRLLSDSEPLTTREGLIGDVLALQDVTGHPGERQRIAHGVAMVAGALFVAGWSVEDAAAIVADFAEGAR